MPADWIRQLLASPARLLRSKGRPASAAGLCRPRLDPLEDRSVPTAFSFGSTQLDAGWEVSYDATGNLYVTGEFTGTVDFDPGPGATSLTSGGGFSNPILAKYSPAGTLLWAGHLVNASIQGTAVDAAGAVYATGYFWSTADFDMGPGELNRTPGSTYTAFVARYNPDRGLAWVRTFDGAAANVQVQGADVIVDAAGNLYVTGRLANGAADFDPGAASSPLTNAGAGSNNYIVKLDPAGNFVWARQFETTTAFHGVWTHDLAVDAAQNLYLAGIFFGRVDFDPGAGTVQHQARDTSVGDGYVAKLTAAGDLAYVVPIGSTQGREDATGIAVDAAGNAYAAGRFDGSALIDAVSGDTTLVSAGQEDAFVLKLNPTGGLDWARRFGSTGYEAAWDLAFDGADRLYLTGAYAGTVDFDPNAGTHDITYNGGGADVFALTLQTDSTFVEAWGIGGTGADRGQSIAVSAAGGVAVVGRFRDTVDFDPGPDVSNLTSAGAEDAFVLYPTQAVTDQPPTASDGTLTTAEDTTATGTLSASDPDGDPLTYSLVSTADAHGTVTITDPATGAFTYTPDTNYHGPASFTFQATAAGVDSNAATVTIAVNPVNDAPTTTGGSGSTAEDAALDGTLSATDVDGDDLTYTIIDGPANGTLSAFDPATGAFTYTPAANYNGSDSLTFRVNDGTVDSGTATFGITVTAVNDPPAAGDDAASVRPNAGPTPLPVLGNDTAAPDAGETLTITAVTQPAHGTVAVTGGGAGLTYQPALDYSGPDSFTYTISDGNGGTDTATVTVTVAPNRPPTAVVDTATIPEDAGSTPIDVLANDSTAPDAGETLTVLSVTTPASGTAVVAPDGQSIRYTPAPDFAGTDTFYYVVSDGNGALASAPVVVTVPNDGADRLEVVPTPGPLDFVEDRDTSLALDAGLTVGTAAGDVVTKAVLKFSSGYVRGRDALAFTAANGLKGRFNPATGTLTITGKASPDVYEAALRTVQYLNRSQDPVGGPRRVSITLFDVAGAGDPAYRPIHVTAVNDRPTVTLPSTAAAARVGRPVAVLAGLRLADPDTAFLRAATVRLTDPQAGDQWAINGRASGTVSGIAYSVTGGVLTLTGPASLAAYQKVLRLVRLTAATAGPRTLEVTVDDGLLTSDPATRSVAVG